MKTRNGFVSNSSSCSFIVTAKQTPEETEIRLWEVVNFYNKMTGTDYTVKDFFYPCFVATGEFAKKYEADLLEGDKGSWSNGWYGRKVKEMGGVKGQTIIHPNCEDNDFPYAMNDMIQAFCNAWYQRKDDGIEEWLNEDQKRVCKQLKQR